MYIYIDIIGARLEVPWNIEEPWVLPCNNNNDNYYYNHDNNSHTCLIIIFACGWGVAQCLLNCCKGKMFLRWSSLWHTEGATPTMRCPHLCHKRATLHRSLQPLYRRTHKVSRSVVLPSKSPIVCRLINSQFHPSHLFLVGQFSLCDRFYFQFVCFDAHLLND